MIPLKAFQTKPISTTKTTSSFALHQVSIIIIIKTMLNFKWQNCVILICIHECTTKAYFWFHHYSFLTNHHPHLWCLLANKMNKSCGILILFPVLRWQAGKQVCTSWLPPFGSRWGLWWKGNPCLSIWLIHCYLHPILRYSQHFKNFVHSIFTMKKL